MASDESRLGPGEQDGPEGLFPRGAAPQKLGKYRVLRRLAVGGMGEILLATMEGAPGFEREVVLKVLHPHLARDRSFARSMLDEARLTVLLRHPNIVHMYNLEKEGDLLYCVMEHVPGYSLSSVQRHYRRAEKAVTLHMAVYIALEVLEGLTYAHELTDEQGEPLGIIHRDISPENILVTPNGFVKIIDFGIAKATTRITKTRPGMIKGKFAYMAPEQFKTDFDHRVDLFALGVVLWETLAGYRLFYSDDKMDTMQKVLQMEPPPIHQIVPNIPEDVDRVLCKALAKNPDRRYASARAFRADLLELVAPVSREDLRKALDLERLEKGFPQAEPSVESSDIYEDPTPVVEPGPTVCYPADMVPGPPRSRRWLWTFVAVVLGIGLALAGWLGVRHLRSRGEPPADGGVALAAVTGPVAEEPGAGPDAGTAAAEPADSRSADAGHQVAQVTPEAGRPRPPPVKLTQKIINRVMRRNGAKFQSCADTHLARQGAGKDVELMLDFTIAGSGQVSRASLAPPALASSGFGKCLLNRVRRLRFPRHRDKQVSINYPLKFRVVAR